MRLRAPFSAGGRRSLLLGSTAALALSAWPMSALAQATRPTTPATPPSSRPAEAAGDEDPGENTVDEVVVTARRAEPGAVVGDIKPELQLSPRDIRSYGVSSVTELLTQLTPQTGSVRGRGGERPVVLLNGRRISGFQEIRDVPIEAIQRVDILPEEAAIKYGFRADQRVVNIVLRRRFRAITAEGQIGTATEGGGASGKAEVNLLRLRGDDRLTLDLAYQRAAGLTEAERGVTGSTSGGLFDLRGNVLGAAAGGEIDPALSRLVGQPVTVAGVPVATAIGRLTLGDFATTAGVPNAIDVGRYRSLTPATESLTGNAVLTRPVPNGIKATLNATVEINRSDSDRGLAGVSLLVPAGDPFSPFGTDARVQRFVEPAGPLQQSIEGWTGRLGFSLNKDMARWRASLTGAYNHADTFTVSGVGVDPTAAQALLSARSAGFDPFGALDPALFPFRSENKARTTTDNADVQLVMNGPVYRLPAGDLFASLKLGDAQTFLSSSSRRLGVEQSADLSRNGLQAQGSLDFPIASRRSGVLAGIGDLSLNLNGEVEQLSDYGTLTTLGYGLNWSPVAGLSFIVSRTFDQNAPTLAQLGAPVVLTPGARVLDFVTGQTVDVTRVEGGAAGLQADHRDVIKIGVNWKPISTQDLTFTADFARSRIDQPIRTFPAVTAEIEAAFPDRFVRDASGRLIQVDLRPVNFEAEDRDEIRWGFNYSRPIGPATPPPGFGRFGGGPGGFGGRGGREGGDAARGARARGDGANTDAPESDRSASAAPDRAPQSSTEAGAGGQGGPRPGGGEGGRGGFGGGPGGFGGRGGYGGGGFGGRGFNQGRLQFAVYHTLTLRNEILVRSGGPLFDLLNGSAASSNGGQPQHTVSAQAGYFRNGLGARFSAEWRSGTRVAGLGTTTGDLDFSDLTTVDLRLFADLGQRRDLVAKHPWLRGARVSLAVTNLFDQRIEVTNAQGVVPVSYQGAYLDPTGRSIRLSFRKLFF